MLFDPDENPYAPPTPTTDSRFTPRSRPVVLGGPEPRAWHDQAHLIFEDGADISDHCARCGRLAVTRLRLELAVEGCRVLRIGLCKHHRRRRQIQPRRVFVAGIALFGVTLLWAVASRFDPVFMTPLAGSLLLAINVMIVMLAVVERHLITFEGIIPTSNGESLVRVGGLHQNVITGLPKWPQ